MPIVRNTLPLRRFFTRKTAAPLVLILALAGAWVLGGGVSHAQLDQQAPPSLKVLLTTGGISVPEPPNLYAYLKGDTDAEKAAAKQAAIRLGKALFWDMQVGSDGKMACASCHFHAGADSRDKNQLNPGLLAGDTLFGNSTILGVPGFPQFKPNYELQLADFPFHRREDPERQRSNPTQDTNDIVSSQGVVLKTFTGINPNPAVAEDSGTVLADTVFQVGGTNVRRVEPVNAPSVINAVFNLSNFLNGRAHQMFNGEDPHGPANQNAGAWHWNGTNLVKKRLDGTSGLPPLTFSSLASQATGPPVSDLEMSWRGRTWPQVGKKMLSRKPLALQAVHHNDSVFGDAAPGGPWYNNLGNGLNFATYANMVQAAFRPEFYNSPKVIAFDNQGRATVKNPTGAANEFTQAMVNFPLIFGLSVQLYQATLVSDETRFDKIMEGSITPTLQEVEGASVFFNEGKCNQCHAGSLFTNAAVDVLFGPNAPPGEPVAVIELMTMFDRGLAIYDTGFYNIGVRPTAEDIGRGGTTPFKNPANNNKRFPLSFSEVSLLDQAGKLPGWYDPMVFLPALTDPLGNPITTRTAVKGALKTPSLRNVELTGPYFRNGGAATLMQTVEFYVRGADFPQANHRDLDAFIAEIPLLIEAITPGGQVKQESLVAFLLTLTDERVRNEQAPFDHPAIEVPYGHNPGTLQTEFLTIPPVGAAGNAAPLQPFLWDSSSDFHFKAAFP